MIRTSIDFGTSMTMMQTMDGSKYEAGSTDCRPIRFTQNQEAATPTLVRIDPSMMHNTCYGAAARDSQWGKLYANFKLLPEDDPEGQARIEQFFSYLYHCYETERAKLYPNQAGGKEETIVGYPVQWSETRRNAILAAAEKAGFQNVQGKNEAEASVICALTHCQQELPKDRPIPILVLDMGAGTTDLAFVEVRVEGGSLNTTLRGVWPPKEQGLRFGGSDLDACLEEYVTQWLESCGLGNMGAGFVQNYLSSNRPVLKSWKENEVSKALSQNLEVTSCALGDWLFNLPGVTRKPFPAFGREGFEKLAKKELDSFVRIISSAPEAWRRDTELVILTGGNSQWYWVSQLLLEENNRFDSVGLPLLGGHPERLLALAFPTEVVSRGLVYNPSKIRFRQPQPPKAQKNTHCKAAREEVNIHEQWRMKLAGKAPDMNIMNRIYQVYGDALVAADSGRVLTTNKKYQPKNTDIVEIIDTTHFRTRSGNVVGLDGELHMSLKKNDLSFLANPNIGIEGTVSIKLGTGSKTKSISLGVCKNGSITFASQQDLCDFLSEYPTFQNNGNGTVGKNIISIVGTPDERILVLDLDGAVYYHGKDGIVRTLFNAGASWIDRTVCDAYILTENGTLYNCGDKQETICNPTKWISTENCVAVYGKGGGYALMVDTEGKVRFLRDYSYMKKSLVRTASALFDVASSGLIHSTYVRWLQMENWNLHDL